jgi:exonuclease SbcC
VRITRLYLRNFRVYEDELDLHLPAGLVGIYGPNGGGKCLPANTRVWDGDTGEALSIERFVNERRKHLIGFTAGKASVVPVSDWHVLGARPTVTVALDSGATLEVATTHPVLTDRGCRPAGDLQPGDWVAEVRRLPEVAPGLLTDDEAFIVGALLGDGTLRGDQVRLSAADDDIVQRFTEAVERVFPGCTVRSSTARRSHVVVSALSAAERRERRAALARTLQEAGVALEELVGANTGRFLRGEASPSWHALTTCEDELGLDLWADKCALYGGRAVTEWARSLGIHGHGAFTKQVPERFLLMPDGPVRHLLAGLMLTDGYIGDIRLSGTPEVSYTSRSLQLVKDVRTLFLRLSMTSTIRQKMVHDKPAFTVVLTAASHTELSQLPLVGRKKTRADDVCAARQARSPRPMFDLIPPAFCRDLPIRSASGRERTRTQLARHAMSRQTFLDFGGDPDIAEADTLWARVERVEATGRSVPCFDVTVDTPEHLYVADTFIVHNSSLVEAIRWTLYGKARTPNDQIRTSGINGECVTEVEFEHEGHLYLVRRTIAGVNHSVKAEAHWNGQQVAEGVRDVATYVHSVIGMDDTAFRASVFAEQKQIAAFSATSPQKRRDLVLRLLGITPLDKARDTARSDARDARADHERLAARLPDLAELEELVAAATAHAEQATAEVTDTDSALATAQQAAEAAEARLDELDDLARTYEALVVEGKAAARVVDESAARVAALAGEQASLAEAEQRLAELRPLAEGIEALDALAGAQAALAALAVIDEPAPPDEAGAAAAQAAAETAAATAAELAGSVRAAEAELARAETAAARSAELSPDEDCPVCGQSLGDAFEQVVHHRAAELAAATTRLAAERKRLVAAEKASTAAAKQAKAATTALAASQRAWSAWEQHAVRRAEAEAALAAAVAHPAFATALAPPPAADATRVELEQRKAAATEVAKLEGRLERAERLAEEVASTTARLEEATTHREALLEKVKALAFKPADLEAAKEARQVTRRQLKVVTDAANEAKQRAATARAAVQTASDRLADGKAQHADIAELADRARHLGRLGDLLNDFRNNVVATVGPRLAAQAAELFGELTDHEYDRLEVDADTYEIQITDAGRTYGMDRFSGSEIDLANLALRVAISEHVRFQSGGAVGLLVLDEVFGPLDDERKERMLLALERLRGRFRQILVVTHDSAIKEQLPGAIQVEKLPGRRARATVLAGA